VFEGGAEGRAPALSGGRIGPRKWGRGVHSATVARNDSRKEAYDGVCDT
jgi:hypothetical protein